MRPLSQYEITELMDAMGNGLAAAPIGSLWTDATSHDGMLMVLLHSNQMGDNGSYPCIVFQALPSGEAWTIPTEEFIQGRWANIGFIWDRKVLGE